MNYNKIDESLRYVILFIFLSQEREEEHYQNAKEYAPKLFERFSWIRLTEKLWQHRD